MAYDSGTHIDSELMLVKDDREMDAIESLLNAQDGKHRRLIGRGASFGLLVFIGQMRLALKVTLMAMWQPMRFVMRSLQQLVLVI